jgi:hypothetical protein
MAVESDYSHTCIQPYHACRKTHTFSLSHTHTMKACGYHTAEPESELKSCPWVHTFVWKLSKLFSKDWIVNATKLYWTHNLHHTYSRAAKITRAKWTVGRALALQARNPEVSPLPPKINFIHKVHRRSCCSLGYMWPALTLDKSVPFPAWNHLDLFRFFTWSSYISCVQFTLVQWLTIWH